MKNAKWITLGIKLYPMIAMAVQMVEKLARGTGKEKQDAAVEAVGVGLQMIEMGMEKDLLDDAEVNAAVRSAVDSFVHLQNIIALKRAALAAGTT